MSSVDIYSILSSKPHNPHYLNRYWKFICACSSISQHINDFEVHHICPKSADLFPEYASFSLYPWNAIRLSKRCHFIAHWLLAKTYGGCQTYAFWAMANKQSSASSPRNYMVSSRVYSIAKGHASEFLRKIATGRNQHASKRIIPSLPCVDQQGNRILVSYSEFKDKKLTHINKGMVAGMQQDGIMCYVSTLDFVRLGLVGNRHGVTTVIDVTTNERKNVTISEYRSNKNLKSIVVPQKTLRNIITQDVITIELSQIDNYDSMVWVDISCTGFYITPIGKYASSNHPDLQCIGTPTSIIKWCKQANTLRLSRRAAKKTKWATNDDVGKLFVDLGFSFEYFHDAQTSPQLPDNAPFE